MTGTTRGTLCTGSTTVSGLMSNWRLGTSTLETRCHPRSTRQPPTSEGWTPVKTGRLQWYPTTRRLERSQVPGRGLGKEESLW